MSQDVSSPKQVVPQEAVHERWLIHGKVQGVGYRWHMQQAARLLKLHGWCRNIRPTETVQTVEAFISGPAEAVKKLHKWALHGPPEAKVQQIECVTMNEISAADAQAFPFQIRR